MRRVKRALKPACWTLLAWTAIAAVIVHVGHAAPVQPPAKVAVYLKVDPLFTDSTRQFLDVYGVAPGYISYTILSRLATDTDLARFDALVVDEGVNQQLTADEAAAVRAFVDSGRKIVLAAWPGFSTQPGINHAAYQPLSDLFGNAVVATDRVRPEAAVSNLVPNTPYTLSGRTVMTYNDRPFYTINAAGPVLPWLQDPATGQAFAVRSQAGVFVTNAIGEEYQSSSANEEYYRFLMNAIVWAARARGAPEQFTAIYLPFVRKGR